MVSCTFVVIKGVLKPTEHGSHISTGGYDRAVLPSKIGEIREFSKDSAE